MVIRRGLDYIKTRATNEDDFIDKVAGTISHVMYEEFKYVVHKGFRDETIDVQSELDKVIALYLFNDKMKLLYEKWKLENCRLAALSMYKNKEEPTLITNQCPWAFEVYYDGVLCSEVGNTAEP